MHKITKILRKLKGKKIIKKLMDASKKNFAEFEKARKK